MFDGVITGSLPVKHYPRFFTYSFNQLRKALLGGQVDIIMSGYSITPKRTRDIRFVGPYLEYGKCIITKSPDLARFGNLSELNEDAINSVLGISENSSPANGQPSERREIKFAVLSNSTSADMLSNSTKQQQKSDENEWFDKSIRSVPFSDLQPLIDAYLNSDDTRLCVSTSIIECDESSSESAILSIGDSCDDKDTELKIVPALTDASSKKGWIDIQGILADYPTCVMAAMMDDKDQLYVMLSLKKTEHIGIGVHPASVHLAHMLDTALATLKHNATLLKLRQSWVEKGSKLESLCEDSAWRVTPYCSSRPK